MVNIQGFGKDKGSSQHQIKMITSDQKVRGQNRLVLSPLNIHPFHSVMSVVLVWAEPGIYLSFSSHPLLRNCPS